MVSFDCIEMNISVTMVVTLEETRIAKQAICWKRMCICWS